MYFNYSTHWAANWWDQQSFLRAWRSIYAGDNRWVPPDHAALARLVHGKQHPFYATLNTQPLYLEALPRRSGQAHYNPNASLVGAATFEEPVAAALVQVDPRREDGTAYLSLLHCANDEETVERLLGAAMEWAGGFGCTRLVGPIGITPSWQPGALTNHFQQTPPLHTPYNPPYLAEVLATTMEPWLEHDLYSIDVPPGPAPAPASPAAAPPGPAELSPLDPARLAGDLLPLLAAALESIAPAELEAFPPPDAAEAAALLRWLNAYPLTGWLATLNDKPGGSNLGRSHSATSHSAASHSAASHSAASHSAASHSATGQPVGFILLQPDLAAEMRRVRGGRNLWAPAARLRKSARTAAGRLLLGAVAPRHRSQGIARQLYAQALAHAQQQGWRSLTTGPISPDSEAAAFLIAQGAKPQQHYVIYEWGDAGPVNGFW